MRILIALCLLLAPVVAQGAGITADKITMSPQASPSCTSGRACIYAKSSDSRVYVKDAAGLELQSNAARSFRTSSNCSGLSSPALGDVCYDSTLDQFLFYTSFGWKPAVVEIPFVRTCTLTSAAAATPVNCLSNADVPATMKPYIAGWHAKINGATGWSTTATCWIQDTSGTSNIFVTTAVAAMTGNAFLNDSSANVTKNNPYALGTGGTVDLGLEIACDANGTGSNWVVTIYGVIK